MSVAMKLLSLLGVAMPALDARAGHAIDDRPEGHSIEQIHQAVLESYPGLTRFLNYGKLAVDRNNANAFISALQEDSFKQELAAFAANTSIASVIGTTPSYSINLQHTGTLEEISINDQFTQADLVDFALYFAHTCSRLEETDLNGINRYIKALNNLRDSKPKE